MVVISFTSEHRTKIIVKDVPHYRASRWNGHHSCLSLGIPVVYVTMKLSTMKVKTQQNLLAMLELWC